MQRPNGENLGDPRNSLLECLTCGERQPVEVAESFHASTSGIWRSALLEGRFNTFRCPRCAAWCQIEEPVAYVDFPRRHWFVVAPSRGLSDVAGWRAIFEQGFRDTMVERAAPVARALAPEFTRRLIFGLASLREKLVAFEAGLDDRPLELLKLQLLVEWGLPLQRETYLFLVEASGPELIFEAAPADEDGTWRLPVGRPRYAQIARDPASRRALPGLWEDVAVDWRASLADAGP